MVTRVPPRYEPELGLIDASDGMYVYKTVLLVGPPVFTQTLPGPPTPAGDVPVHKVDVQLTPVAPTPLKRTLVTPGWKPEPETVNAWPPAAGPELGDRLQICGPLVVYVNWSEGEVVLVPNGVVKVTSTRPQPGGAVTVSWVALLTLTLVPAAAPKATEVEPETKPVPVTVTDAEQP